MNATTRRIFPYLMLLLILSALGWAVSFGTLPKADFTFNNGTEIQTVDPAKATGSPEGRIINALFEGLLRNLPEKEATDP
ncbi:MAG: peptide ABC transporter substrate-binding protein, partial [Pirellulaceae bacterium]